MATQDNDELNARRDYAQSVQARTADTISARIAEAWRQGGDAAQEHLAKVRQRFADAGIDFDAGEAERRAIVLEQLHELDEPDVRRIVEMHVARIQEGARRLGLPQLEAITSSSLPGGSVNAMCANDPGDGTHHVFADGELLVFCNSLGKLVATAFTSEAAPTSAPFVLAEPMHGPTRALLDIELGKRVVDLYAAVLFTGRSRVSEPWVPDHRAMMVSAGLAWGMGAFAIAHEIGHAAAGHLVGESLSADAGTETAASLSRDQEFAASLSRDQEFEADGLAFELIMATCWGDPSMPFHLLGPYVFLKGIELLEEGQAVFGDSRSAFESHPATSERLLRLRLAISTVLPDLELKLLSVKALARIDGVFLAWRAQLLLFLGEAQKAGYAPSDGRIPYRARFERPAILGG